MRNLRLLPRLLTVVVIFLFLTSIAKAQSGEIYHQLEGKLQLKTGGAVASMRVRLVRRDSLEPVAETFTRTDGGFAFTRVTDGDYLIETFETDQFEATSTEAILRPRPRRPMYLNVYIDIPVKSASRVKPGVIAADVDLNVPKAAQKHYKAAAKAIQENDFVKAEPEFREAIAAYQNYYQARLEFGRELRLRKRFADGAEVLQPLLQIAPTRADPRLEYGICLLELKRREEAIQELRRAVTLEESSWASHLYLGWALLETSPEESEPEFKRAIQLNERKAARAYLALARLADSRGQNLLAIQYLEAYLTLMPNAADAEMARKLLAKLRGA
jgi:tetratricopeptide (TPR) repeat protein